MRNWTYNPPPAPGFGPFGLHRREMEPRKLTTWTLEQSYRKGDISMAKQKNHQIRDSTCFSFSRKNGTHRKVVDLVLRIVCTKQGLFTWTSYIRCIHVYTVILEDIYRLRHSLRDVPAPVTVGRLPPTSHRIAEKTTGWRSIQRYYDP